MKISRLKIKFLSALEAEYPPEEAGSFFNLLSEAYLDKTRLDIALNPDDTLSAEKIKYFDKATERLLRHEPIQYILGETEFFGMKFMVNPNVLIPRPETEELVQWVIDDIGDAINSENLRIFDIGTGSGCIAIGLAKAFPQAKVSAIDISEKAIQTASENAKKNNVEIEFIQADILQQDKLNGKFDVIISNPPYVRELEKEKMQRNVLEHEPATALYVKNEDPLIFYRKITKLAKDFLAPKGKLYFEINQYLEDETRALMEEQGFKTALRKDIFGNFRMLKGEKNICEQKL